MEELVNLEKTGENATYIYFTIDTKRKNWLGKEVFNRKQQCFAEKMGGSKFFLHFSGTGKRIWQKSPDLDSAVRAKLINILN